MESMNLDEEYLSIAKNIINDEDFLKLKECRHHGISRYDHSIKVSYQAYKYAKKRDLNYKEIAVGGLLHDFYETDNNPGITQRCKTAINHPEIALKNATDKYNLSKVEKDIIASHMFPLGSKIPKYKESWIITCFDKKIAFSEYFGTFMYKTRTTTNILILLLFNLIK